MGSNTTESTFCYFILETTVVVTAEMVVTTQGVLEAQPQFTSGFRATHLIVASFARALHFSISSFGTSVTGHVTDQWVDPKQNRSIDRKHGLFGHTVERRQSGRK